MPAETDHVYELADTYLARLDVVTSGSGTVVSNEIEITVTPPPPIPGDFDGDKDVDLADFGHLQACLSGSAVPQTDPDCQDAVLDADSDVDQTDVAIFLGCLSGANVPADPNCAEQ